MARRRARVPRLQHADEAHKSEVCRCVYALRTALLLVEELGVFVAIGVIVTEAS